MALNILVTEDDIFTVLRTFLGSILPVDIVNIVQGQDNRVPEPLATDFVTMTPTRRDRISTNVDSFEDDAYIGSISGSVLTITKILAGAVKENAIPTSLPAPAAGTVVGTQITGQPGSIGTYNVSPSQTLASTILQAGGGSYLQATKITIQLDVHGPNSGDNAQIISTMMRDDYAYEAFIALNPAVTPLYADDPIQLPFENDQQQVENRWVISCVLQANITVQAPQQFADNVDIGLVNVDVVYPPS